ncbi:hypothetical protein NDU88_003983 [Pleurodeles waltl]|uniref:Uncharacterized protein n=1 Tax=Pleurodeles waltl TaxID=8319 RepID=A0AAV7MTH9_PLEWA|nr:hypothetical protein NDU88_003983 [Pleurodeles waltl]
MKNVSLTSFLKCRDKGNTPGSGVISRPLIKLTEGTNISNKEPRKAQESSEKTLLGSVTVHDVRCSNRFSLLEPQGQIEESGNSNPSARLTSHHSTISHTQEDLIALIADLKEEVKDLKTLLVEVMTLFRSESYQRETPITHMSEQIINTASNEDFAIREKILSCANSNSDQNTRAPQISFISPPSAKFDSGAAMFSRPHTKLAREPIAAQTLYQPKGSGYPILMCGVPPLAPNAHEDRPSLINKATHWIRHTRQCGSIIHSDIISAQRFPEIEGHLDTIKLVFSTPELVKGLLDLEMRNPLQNGSNICFKSCWPVDDFSTRSNTPDLNSSPRPEKEILSAIFEETSVPANKRENAYQNVKTTTRSLVQMPVALDTD